ncbi:MAG: galactokinase [Bacteroidota bacterium]|jgi:galactokinase
MNKAEVSVLFASQFGVEPSYVVASPGRINLIGEHVDYNSGFVLPAAIDKYMYVAVSERSDNALCMHAVDVNQSFQTSLLDPLQHTNLGWPNYILGVIDALQIGGYSVKGFNILITGNIPVGAGVSSSAALECATVFACKALFNLDITKEAMVKTAQLAENKFVGVNCGVMDQFASMFGKADHVIKLDCADLSYTYFPFKLKGISIVLFDTFVKHSLASSEYNTRRQECEAGLAAIRQQFKVASFREATLQMLDAVADNISTSVYNRCTYVIQEIARMEAACTHLLAGEIADFGARMYETHTGLSKLYEVSCPELDLIVENCIPAAAIIGARMMGGGFGGCVIALVKTSEVDTVYSDINAIYEQTFGQSMGKYVMQIGDGTTLL